MEQGFTFEEIFELANKGDLNAQYVLANCYEQGVCVEKDSEKAFYWFLKCAERGDAQAQIRASPLHRKKPN